MLNLPMLPPGFRGMDRDLPLTTYHRHLPHWRQAGAAYFVTFRLADSLPQEKMQLLKRMRDEWEREYPPPRSEQAWEEYAREVTRRTEAWLDEGYGACYFRQSRFTEDMRGRLHHFDRTRYQLSVWVIMPNHVHLVIKPFEAYELEDLIGAMKGVVARHINAALGLGGALWEKESYDRIIRDGEHLWKVIQYIGGNPRMAGLPRDEWYRWIAPDWESAGWGFRDEA